MDETERKKRQADDKKWNPIIYKADVNESRTKRDQLLDALDELLDGIEHEVGWKIGKAYREIAALTVPNESRTWSWREEIDRILKE